MGKFTFAGLAAGLVLAAVTGCDPAPATVSQTRPGAMAVSSASRLRGGPAQMASELDPVDPPKPGASRTPPHTIGAGGFGGPGGPGYGSSSPTIGVAEESVTGPYRAADGSTVEVAGVCKMVEDGVVCWKPDGSPNKDLASQIKARLEERFVDANFNFRFNRKNRFVVAKVRQVLSTSGGNGSLSVIDAGQAFGTAAGSLPITLPVENPAGPKQPWSHYEIRAVAELKTAKSTVLRITETSLVDSKGALIPCEMKAEGSIAGESYRVVAVHEMPKVLQPGIPTPWWTIRLQRVRKDKRNMQVNAIPCDLNGRQITFVDTQGNPIPAEVYQKAMSDLRAHPRVPGVDVQNYRFADVRVTLGNGTTDLGMNIDPAKVSRLRLVGRYVKRIDLIGIPLDPK